MSYKVVVMWENGKVLCYLGTKGLTTVAKPPSMSFNEGLQAMNQHHSKENGLPSCAYLILPYSEA